MLKRLPNITEETALLAKEKGFPQEDYSGCTQNPLKPLQAILQQWLRDEHKIRVLVTHREHGVLTFEIRRWNYDNNLGEWKWERNGNIPSWETYEEALEGGLKEALRLVKTDPI